MDMRFAEIPLVFVKGDQVYVRDHLGANHRIGYVPIAPICTLLCEIEVPTCIAAWKYITNMRCIYLHIRFVGTLANKKEIMQVTFGQTHANEVFFDFHQVKGTHADSRLLACAQTADGCTHTGYFAPNVSIGQSSITPEYLYDEQFIVRLEAMRDVMWAD